MNLNSLKFQFLHFFLFSCMILDVSWPFLRIWLKRYFTIVQFLHDYINLEHYKKCDHSYSGSLKIASLNIFFLSLLGL